MRKGYLTIVLALLLAGPVLAVSPAVLVDPYGVYGTGFNTRNFEPDTRFLTTAYLLEHPEIDRFVLGSSRANAYRVDTLRQITGHDFFNLNVSAETAEGMRDRLKWLLSTRTVRQLVVSLDYDFTFQTESFRKDDYLRREHPAVSGKSYLAFYAGYLFVPYRETLTALTNVRAPGTSTYLFDVASGQHRLPAWEADMRADPEGYAAALSTATVALNRKRYLSRQMDAYRELVAMIRAHDIDAVFLINPIYWKRMQSFHVGDYLNWLRELAGVGQPVWDFSGFNPVTTNERFFYEISHFTPAAGNLVLFRAFGAAPPGLPMPPGFGILITPETVEDRIGRLGGTPPRGDANGK